MSIIDECEAISRRLQEIEADKQLALTGSTLPAEEPKVWPMWAHDPTALDDFYG